MEGLLNKLFVKKEKKPDLCVIDVDAQTVGEATRAVASERLAGLEEFEYIMKHPRKFPRLHASGGRLYFVGDLDSDNSALYVISEEGFFWENFCTEKTPWGEIDKIVVVK